MAGSYSGGVCTPNDPQGKKYQPNTADGRLYTQEVRADNRTPRERAESQARFQHELMCQRGITGAIACNRPIFEFKSAEISGSAFGYGTGVKTDGTMKGTEWDGINKGKSKKPTARAGICVQLKGAKKSEHKAEAKGAVGYVWGSIDPANQSLCVGGQFPPGLDGSVTVK